MIGKMKSRKSGDMLVQIDRCRCSRAGNDNGSAFIGLFCMHAFYQGTVSKPEAWSLRMTKTRRKLRQRLDVVQHDGRCLRLTCDVESALF
jgi:hypothetical protein